MKRVIICAPTGMSLRHLLAPPELLRGLNERFRVKILSYVKVRGEKRYHNVVFGDLVQKWFVRALCSVLNRLTSYIRISSTVDFLVQNDLGEPLRQRARLSDLTTFRLFLNLIGRSSVINQATKIAVRILTLVTARVQELLDIMVIIEPSEIQSKSMALVCNQHQIPVVVWPLGTDNLRHGYLHFKCDLLLAWGREQSEKSRSYQKAFCENSLIVGNFLHHRYTCVSKLKRESSLSVDSKIKNKYFVYGAMLGSALPNQFDVVKAISRMLEIIDPSVNLVVRLLPLCHERAEWERIEREASNIILTETASGAFDKRYVVVDFDISEMEKEIDEYANLLAGSLGVIAQYPPTVLIDAIGLGVWPVLLFIRDDNGSPVAYEKVFASNLFRNPQFQGYNPIGTIPDLDAFIKSCISDPAAPIPDHCMRLYKYIASEIDSPSAIPRVLNSFDIV